MTGTLKKIGGSLAVIIPKPMSNGFTAGEKIELTEQNNGILLTRSRVRVRRPVHEIVKQMDSTAYVRHNHELFGDMPVGRETW